MNTLEQERNSREITAMRKGGKIIRHGSFKCAYRTEPFAVVSGVLLVVIVAVLVFNFLAAEGVNRANIYIALAVCVVIEFIWNIIWAFVKMGRECQYDAQETEMEVKGPGKRHEIFYYSDVQEVKFDEIKSMSGQIRGYQVTVTTSIRDVTYRCLFDSMGRRDSWAQKTVKDIPFYYLAVNCGLMDEELYDDEGTVTEHSMEEAFLNIRYSPKDFDSDEFI